MARSIAIRLGTDGKAQVKADFGEIATSGDAAARRWGRSFEKAGNDVQAAMQRQANAAAKLAMITPQTPMQMRINDANGSGFGQWEGSARQSAAAFRELYAEQEKLENGARALRASLDPLTAAQDRYNAEIGKARTLVSAGVISLDEYVAVLGRERAALDANSTAKKRNGSAMVALAPQLQDVFTQASMGANIFNVLAVQGGQAAGQMIYLGGAAGKFGNFMMGPWGLALTGGTMLLGALTKGLFDNEAASARAEAGMQKFQARQSDIANFIDFTTGRLKEQNRELVLGAILTRERQLADNAAAISSGRNKAFDAARNLQDRNPTVITSPTSGAPISVRQTDRKVEQIVNGANGDVAKLTEGLFNLAKASGDPRHKELAQTVSGLAGNAVLATRENEDLRKELRGLNGDTTALARADTSLIAARAKLAGATKESERAQARYTIAISQAEAAYDASGKTAADQQRLLNARTKAERDLNVAQDANNKGGEARNRSLARQSEAMEVNASAAHELARAYLAGGDAAIKAEAMRRGATDATRRGIDSEAEVRRRLNIMIGDALVDGAQNVAQLGEETAARKLLIDRVLSGELPFERMAKALSDEAALRPLLKLQTMAQGESLTLLTKIIGDYRKALEDANAEEGRSAALSAKDATAKRIIEIEASIADLDKSPLEAAIAAARRAAKAEAKSQNFSPADAAAFEDARARETEVQFRGDGKRFVKDASDRQADTTRLMQRELELVGATDEVRERELEKLSLKIELERQAVDLSSEAVRKLLEGIDAQSAARSELQRTAGVMDDLRRTGKDFVDTILSEDTWSSWGNAGRTVVNMLKTEFLKLALFNPIKNLISGKSDNATLTDAFKGIGKLFGKNAAGTEYWSGGLSLVGEHGPEMVNMPRGSRVSTAAETRRMFQGAPSGPVLQFDLRGAVMTEDLLSQMQQLATQAAQQGALGGRMLSRQDSHNAAKRRLGRG